jgi:hypothetical protein
LPEITIRLHPDLAEKLLAAGPEGARSLSSLWRQVDSAVQSHGPRIAYAPAVLPDGLACAMSVHLGLRGMVVEVDRPGTLIRGRGVAAERDEAPHRPPPWRPLIGIPPLRGRGNRAPLSLRVYPLAPFSRLWRPADKRRRRLFRLTILSHPAAISMQNVSTMPL